MRRRQLLDAASSVFVRDGLAGVTMAAIAREAGVSRRLVYDHFADLAELYAAFFEERTRGFVDALDRRTDALTHPAGGSAAVALEAAFGALLAVPAEDQRALRLLVADGTTPELEPVRDRLRRRLDDRWMPVLRRRGVDERLGRAVLWASMSAVLALANLAERGEIDPASATVLARNLVAALGPAIPDPTHPESSRPDPTRIDTTRSQPTDPEGPR